MRAEQKITWQEFTINLKRASLFMSWKACSFNFKKVMHSTSSHMFGGCTNPIPVIETNKLETFC